MEVTDITRQRKEKIIKHYGLDNQIDKLAEEHAELQHALRNKDVEHVTEEIADVLCLIEQIADEMKVDWMKVRETVNEKVEREMKRIETTK